MARAPFAKWRPLPQNSSAPRIDARTMIFHTMVGNLLGVERYFSGRSGGIESHFGVACPRCEAAGVAEDGEVWQWMDTGRRADANYRANGFAISVETCDHYTGGTYTNPGLSAAQVRSWTRLGIWAADVHDISRRRCPAWDAGGFGFHAMWGAPSNWTPAQGKTCPNPTRIRQFNDVVLPAIRAGRLEEDDFPVEQADFNKLMNGWAETGPGKKALRQAVTTKPAPDEVSADSAWSNTQATQATVNDINIVLNDVANALESNPRPS